MATLKTTEQLHDDLREAMRSAGEQLAEASAPLAAGSVDASALQIALAVQKYASDLARVLSDVLHTLGGLAIATGQDRFAMGDGIHMPEQ